MNDLKSDSKLCQNLKHLVKSRPKRIKNKTSSKFNLNSNLIEDYEKNKNFSFYF